MQRCAVDYRFASVKFFADILRTTGRHNRSRCPFFHSQHARFKRRPCAGQELENTDKNKDYSVAAREPLAVHQRSLPPGWLEWRIKLDEKPQSVLHTRVRNYWQREMQARRNRHLLLKPPLSALEDDNSFAVLAYSASAFPPFFTPCQEGRESVHILLVHESWGHACLPQMVSKQRKPWVSANLPLARVKRIVQSGLLRPLVCGRHVDLTFQYSDD
eukprot:1268265-Pleurochrysis_carterae.AAC.3